MASFLMKIKREKLIRIDVRFLVESDFCSNI